MKGVVFTEFLEMVESRFGFDTVDDILDTAAPPSGGVYAATGTYPHEELVALVVALSKKSQIPIPDLLKAYGQHLFARLAASYPMFTAASPDAFSFLQTIDKHIHVEVRKIYPDAELPRFVTRLSPDRLELQMEYRSPRRFDDLAEGLILGCLEAYGTTAAITRQPLPGGDPGTLFVLRKTTAPGGKGPA